MISFSHGHCLKPHSQITPTEYGTSIRESEVYRQQPKITLMPLGLENTTFRKWRIIMNSTDELFHSLGSCFPHKKLSLFHIHKKLSIQGIAMGKVTMVKSPGAFQ
jgi:hypothetical protein